VVAEEVAVMEVAVVDTVVAVQEVMMVDTDLVAVEVDTAEVEVAEEAVDATTAERRATWPESAQPPPRDRAATHAIKLDISPGIAPIKPRSLADLNQWSAHQSTH